MLRLSRLLIVLLALPVMACDAASVWMAGVDHGRYGWEPMVGTKDDQNAAQALRDCEAPGAPAPPGAAADAVTIARAESSPMVEACMAQKGYRKAYQPRDTMF